MHEYCKLVVYVSELTTSVFVAGFANSTEFPEVISVEPSKTYTIATTRSWDFLGLGHTNQMPNELLQRSKYGEDVIIGIVDTG
jgi:hypothetical protein